MTRFLAIYRNVKLPNSIKDMLKQVLHFSKYWINPPKFAQDLQSSQILPNLVALAASAKRIRNTGGNVSSKM